MTTAVAPTPTRAGSYGLRCAIGSEWIKFRSLRSSRYTMLAFAVGTIAIGVIVSAATGSSWKPHHDWDPTNQTLSGLAFGELAMGVLGVLAMTGEHSSGTIRTTFAAIPRRRLVLAAKAVVLGGAALLIGELVTFATFLGGQAVYGKAPAAHLGQPGVARAVIASGVFLGLIGLFGVGLGAIIRHTTGAIGAFAGIVLVLPLILLPVGHLSSYAPESILGSSVAAVVPQDHHPLSWGLGLLMMAIYTGVALLIAAVTVSKRDA